MLVTFLCMKMERFKGVLLLLLFLNKNSGKLCSSKLENIQSFKCYHFGHIKLDFY